MLDKRRLLTNSAASVVQVVVHSVVLFVLYRYLLLQLGAEEFGVWAVVMAATSFAGVANLGLAATAVKFVSQHLARGNTERVVSIAETATISVGAVMAAMLLAVYFLVRNALGLVIESEAFVPVAAGLLPYALVTFWLNAMTGVVHSCINGLQRMDLRAALAVGGALLYLGLCLLLVPRHGLTGLVEAQVLHAATLLVGSWFVLKALLPRLAPLPHRWSRGAFGEMWRYALNTQVISLSQVLIDPTVKVLLSRFGGLGTVAYFEMAHRMVLQVRTLIVTAVMPIVPAVADLQERAPAMIGPLFRRLHRLLSVVCVVCLPILVVATPVISRLWIGRHEGQFVLFAALLFAGSFVNVMASPAFYANLGTGRLRWNVLGHLLIAVLNPTLGLLLGWSHAGPGVVLAYVIALVAGTLVIALAYPLEQGIPLRDLFEWKTVGLGLICLAGAAAALACYRWLEPSWSPHGLAVLIFSMYGVAVLPPLWMHPVRPQVQAFLGTLAGRPRDGASAS